jgi:hypothetical protein
MDKRILRGAAILAVLVQSAHADPASRRAAITGGGSNRKCTIEVTVDGVAEVAISGDTGLLTTFLGAPALWRRFECNMPLPANPVDFRFVKIAGRGTALLLRDPRTTGGRAVIHLNDPEAGRAVYTFELQWRSNLEIDGFRSRVP